MKPIAEFLSEIKITEHPRFSFAVPDTVAGDLAECYRHVVESCGTVFDPSEKTKQIIRSAANWLKNGKNSLILTGKCGTGKSVLLRSFSLLFSYCSGERINMKIITAGDICELTRKKDPTDEEIELLRRLKTYSYLGIDDLGTETLTVKSWGTELSPILDILFSRYENRKTTIITTNDSLEVLGKKYGERIYDRMCEQYDRISFDFKSFRQK